MKSSGCCPQVARALPKFLWESIFVLLDLGLLALGGLFVKTGVEALGISAAKFLSTGLLTLSLGLGGGLLVLGLYGIVGPYCCTGRQVNHIRWFFVLAVIMMLVTATVATVTFLTADDQDAITEALDFGWQKRYNHKEQNYHISNAQTAHNCCGFGKQQDRKITPCPNGAKRGCEFRLRKEYDETLNKLGNMEAMAVGGLVLMILVSYFFAANMDMTTSKDTLGNNPDDQFRADNDHRQPKQRPNRNQLPVTGFKTQ